MVMAISIPTSTMIFREQVEDLISAVSGESETTYALTIRRWSLCLCPPAVTGVETWRPDVPRVDKRLFTRIREHHALDHRGLDLFETGR